jgi:CRP-like cAMP-binding protein/Fe-S-cluster-containing hydrogenase component 2
MRLTVSHRASLIRIRYPRSTPIVLSRSPLAEQVHREVTACIGCHDCLLACPLPEASLVGIADLNAAVHLPVIRSPAVIHFLTACTQCRQCVPVCPADLSRADMVLFNKSKVEDAVPDFTLPLQVGRGSVASPFTLDGLAQQLAAARLFAGVPFADLRRLLLKITLRRLAAGEELCREGEFHERLYVVLEGALEQTAGGVRILVLGPGSFLGEMAIMADQPEPFSVTARLVTVVVEAPKAAVHRLMDAAPAFRATLEALYGRRAIHSYAMRPSVLGALPAPAVEELLAHASLVPLKAGQALLREGQPPEDAFIVRTGFLRVTRKVPAAPAGTPDEVLVYFREGDLFGALALLRDEPAHGFTVTAVSRAEVIRLPGAAFRSMTARHPEARLLWTAGALEAEQIARAQGSGRAPTAAPLPAAHGSATQPLSWNVFVEQGLAEGREVLVVDQTRCTHCNGCVDACGRRHGQSRLELRGIQIEHLLFPTACRHCDDPVCLLCSVSGIVRRPSGEIAIVEESCIGCGACAERCPYGNIRMHPVEPPKRGLFAGLLDFLRGPPAEPPPAEADPKVPRKAVKCDLCEGHDDYACVTACPVGAAFRVDPATAFPTAERLGPR